jgi:hypothetical protein
MTLGNRPGWQIALVTVAWVVLVVAAVGLHQLTVLRGASDDGGHIRVYSIPVKSIALALGLAFVPSGGLLIVWLVQRSR